MAEVKRLSIDTRLALRAAGLGVQSGTAPKRIKHYDRFHHCYQQSQISEAQRRHVSFALLEQIDSLSESYEAHEPEVQDAIRCLEIVRGKLERMGGAA